ncbi:uncharacterized protein ColSpa_02075 [Colletotrichum spaethianum]|uniref:Uncharacterized protein n=1 Tax=Colletotrichum spaethianum TaxID=700344 RepID=A0AA37L8E3_9PEZI|nr:uncharacterized protein ColSpa_02075 [Colletotrichum spaethianum]GKT41894.1 hypothetical protein ColSpa_02075 [Colletotrichum spaethianum]
MCWKKQTIYTGCRHSHIEEIICDDEKKRQRRYAFPAASTSPYKSYQQQQKRQEQREQHHRSSWLVLVCPCFSLFYTSPRKEKCRLKPILEPLNGKCPRCVREEADAAELGGLGVNTPARPEDAVVVTFRRQGFIGDKHLHAEGRSGSCDAYGATGPQRNPHREDYRPLRSRRDGNGPTETGRGGAAAGASQNRPPLWVNARYEEAARQERIRREQQSAQNHEHYQKNAQRVTAYHHRDHGQDQGPSGSTFSRGRSAYSQPSQSRDSTAHLIPRQLQVSKAKENQEMARKARVNGRSTAKARKSPPLSVILEERSSWGIRVTLPGAQTCTPYALNTLRNCHWTS